MCFSVVRLRRLGVRDFLLALSHEERAGAVVDDIVIDDAFANTRLQPPVWLGRSAMCRSCYRERVEQFLQFRFRAIAIRVFGQTQDDFICEINRLPIASLLNVPGSRDKPLVECAQREVTSEIIRKMIANCRSQG
jgi:hypothetical protein